MKETEGCSVFTGVRQAQGQNIDNKSTTNTQLCNPMGCFCTFFCAGSSAQSVWGDHLKIVKF